MNEWMQMSVLVLLVAGLIFPVATRLLNARRRAVERLADPNDDTQPDLIFGPLTTALSAQIPVRPQVKPELQKDLRLAGFYRPTALMEFAAVRAVFVIVPLVVTGVLALLASPEQVRQVLLGGAIAVGLGYSIPRVYLSWRTRVRNREIERSLPLAIDLLTLSLTAGQDLLAALQEVAQELRFSSPNLARELAIAHQQAQLHSLEYAMKQWADRTHLPEVTNLALLLTQSERLGTGAASTLIEFGNYLRTSMRQRAEAQANRTSFWMLFPSVFCFWVAAAIILVGPAYLEFFQQRQRSAVFFNQARQNIDRANQRGLKTPPPATSSAPSASTQPTGP